MSAGTLWPFKEPIWTLEFSNARIAENMAILCFYAKYKDLSVSNVTVPTSQKITVNLGGAARQTKNQTHPDLKQRKGSHALIHSNVQIAEVIIKPIPICIYSGDIDSIESGNKRNMLRSMKTGSSRFVLWRTANLNNDCTKSQSIFTKCLEKLPYYQYHSWDSKPIWHHLHSRTSLVWDCKGETLIGITHYFNWLLFARISLERSDSSRVIAYINIRLSSFHFLLHKDIINHRNIILISFLNNHVYYYIMNIYSDSSHSALKYLKDIEVNIDNVLIMTGDFNIRDSL